MIPFGTNSIAWTNDDDPTVGGHLTLDNCLSRLARNAVSRGVMVAYRPHMGTVGRTGDEIDRLIGDTDPALSLCLDTGHCTFGGSDPAQVARRHRDPLSRLHAKTIRAEVIAQVAEDGLSFLEAVRRGVFTVPEDPDGCLDFVPTLRVAAETDYDSWLVIEAEQDTAVRDPKHYQSPGLDTLRAMALEAGLICRSNAPMT